MVFRRAIPIVLGAVVGVLGWYLGSKRPAPVRATPASEVAPAASTAAEATPDPQMVARWNNARIAVLEQNVAALAAARATPAAGAATGPVAPTSADARMLRAEQLAREQTDYEALTAEHRLESRDTSWARPMEQKMRDGLQAGQRERGYRVDDVDCRQSTCVATLTFASFEDATRSMKSIVEDSSRTIGCLRRMGLAPPEDGQRSYETSLYVDCGQDRAEGAQAK
jgi:hypothetical protein